MTWFVGAIVLEIVRPGSEVSTLLLGGNDPVGLAAILIAIPVLVSQLAVSIRRLHDRNKSAWWLVLFAVCPPIMQVVASMNNVDAAVTVVLMVLSIAIGLWAFIELGMVPGTAGANRYGPDPLADHAA